MIDRVFKDIKQNGKTLIIAEAGVNHNGQLKLAKRLVDVASDAGADAVKFQTFDAHEMVSSKARSAAYQVANKDKPGSQLRLLESLQLSYSDHQAIKKHCEYKGIQFISSPFGIKSVDLLEDVGVVVYKIASGEITNLPLIEYVAKRKRPVLLSTGMADAGEIADAVDLLKKNGCKEIAILHCVSAYPAGFGELNLNAIRTLSDAFGMPVGFSDHTLGTHASIAAIAMGARVIEKHFTLDKSMEGPDHKASLDPDELNDLVVSVRELEDSFGDGIKRPQESELEIMNVVRKSCVAARDINKGEMISNDLVAIKRPGTGIAPRFKSALVGRIAKADIAEDEVFTWEMF